VSIILFDTTVHVSYK